MQKVVLWKYGKGMSIYQVVSCSGAYKDCSLCVVCNGIEIKEQAELQGIKGMWSLRSSTDDPFDTFVVVSFISETRVLTMNHEIELEETEMEGFCSQVQTLFCHDAVHNQLVQSHFKFCLSSTTRELRNEWFAPSGYSVNVATANARFDYRKFLLGVLIISMRFLVNVAFLSGGRSGRWKWVNHEQLFMINFNILRPCSSIHC